MGFGVSTVTVCGYARCQGIRGQALSQVLQACEFNIDFYSPHEVEARPLSTISDA